MNSIGQSEPSSCKGYCFSFRRFFKKPLPIETKPYHSIVCVLTISFFLFPLVVFAQSGLPVFPGAQGFGTDTPAGRGGKVYRVKNLSDNSSDPDSLRHCVNQSGPRVCVFETSGTINLSSRLNINNSFITIAGQTAPSPGITLQIGRAHV